MGSFRTRLLSAFLVLTVSLTLSALAAGCGSVNAKEILDQSQKSMDSIQTVKLHADITTNFMGKTIPVRMEMEEARGGPEGKKTRMTGETEGQVFEMYMVGNITYMRIGASWYKASLPSLVPASGQIGLGSLEDVQQSMAAAESASIVSEDADSYTITYRVGPEYLKQRIEQLKQQGSELIQNVDPGMLGDTTVDTTVKISKTTNYVIESTSKVVSSGGLMGDSSTESKLTVVGFNVPVNVEVPPEALNAPPLPSTPSR